MVFSPPLRWLIGTTASSNLIGTSISKRRELAKREHELQLGDMADLSLENSPLFFPETPAQAEGEAGAARQSETSGGTDEGAKGSMVEKHLLPAEE